MDTPGRADGVAACTALAAVLLASGLEGGTLPQYGGTAIALAGTGLVISGVLSPGGRVGMGARVAAALLILVLAWQMAPIPDALRHALAPGQAAWLDRVAPEFSGDGPAFGTWLANCDVAAATATPPPPFDPLASSVAGLARSGSLLPAALPWALAQILGFLAVYSLGTAVGRSERWRTPVLVIYIIAAVGEALFGIAMRNGPSTGIGLKTYYLGSATGTFINRGHYALFLALGTGAICSLAGAQFPLLAEEIERHRRSTRRSSQPPSVWEASGNRIPKLVLLGLFGALLGVAMVTAQSRGPLIWGCVAALGVGVWVWRTRNEPFYLAFGVGIPLVSGVLAVLALGPRGAFGRFVTLLDASSDVSATSRLQFWHDGLKAWLDAPLFGAGLGAWRVAYGLHESVSHLYDVSHAHDEIVEWLAEAGVCGTGAMLIAVGVWGAGVARGLRVAPHGPAASACVGATLASVTAIGASLGDFPLHTPGTALAVAMFAGIATGSVAGGSGWGRAARVGLGLAAAVVGSLCAWSDHAAGGSRQERLGEVPVDFSTAQVVRGGDEVERRWTAAEAGVLASPVDPWAQLRAARAGAWMSARVAPGRTWGGKDRVDYAMASELGLDRALALRPQDGRVALVAAAVLIGLPGGEYCRRARARDLLARAVALDFWRADEAFRLADALDTDDLAIIAAGRGAGVGAAKVDYAYGQALARRRLMAEAADAYQRAGAEDSTFGPPFFQLAAIAHAAGDKAGTERFARAFLASTDRPGGMEGWAYLLIGDLASAEPRLRRSVEVAPQNQWSWEGLAELYAEKAEAGREAAAWHAVLRLDPKHGKARERLAILEPSTHSSPAPSPPTSPAPP